MKENLSLQLSLLAHKLSLLIQQNNLVLDEDRLEPEPVSTPIFESTSDHWDTAAPYTDEDATYTDDITDGQMAQMDPTPQHELGESDHGSLHTELMIKDEEMDVVVDPYITAPDVGTDDNLSEIDVKTEVFSDDELSCTNFLVTNFNLWILFNVYFVDFLTIISRI